MKAPLKWSKLYTIKSTMADDTNNTANDKSHLEEKPNLQAKIEQEHGNS